MDGRGRKASARFSLWRWFPASTLRPMILWRLAKPGHDALDGEGAFRFGGRYCSPGHRIVHFASEAGLAVLVQMRYLSGPAAACDDPYELGWTRAEAVPERVPDGLDRPAIIATVDAWADSRRSLLMAVRSAVLPEADVVLMNRDHPAAALVPPLTVRPFRFSECLHRPPMLEHYS
jgi:RES domain-containing protein